MSTRDVRKNIEQLGDLKPGDRIVRRMTDETWTVVHVGQLSVMVERVAGGRGRIEALKRDRVIISHYQVLRPETLPTGLRADGVDYFRFQDWAGDTGSISFDTGFRGDAEDYGVGRPDARVLFHPHNGSSLHIEANTLRWLADRADEYAARRRNG